MQKKIIALAVAGLMSGAAFAQSNVEIYGIVDVGYKFERSHSVAGTKNRAGLDNGTESTSRIGFRGTEDLGNGLKAIFVLENELGVDVSSAGGGFMNGNNRQSYLALAGNFGTFAFGRQYSPQHLLNGRFEAFANDTEGQINRIKTTDVRLDNLAAYISPNFGGFNVIAGYTLDAAGNEAAKDAGNLKAWAVNPNYKNGPLDIGLNIHRVSVDVPGGAKVKVMDLGAGYDLGVARVSGIYATRKIDGNVQDSRYWNLSVTAPVGTAGMVKASYNTEKEKEANPDFKEKQVAVGYFHNLSKRTNLSAVYAKRSQDYAGYKTAMTFGIRHKF